MSKALHPSFRILLQVSLGIFMVLIPSLTAKPVVEKWDRIEVDWTYGRLRFFGTVARKSPETFQDATKRALQEGLLYVKEFLANPSKRKDFSLNQAFDLDAGTRISAATFLTGVEVFKEDMVKVKLESVLPRILKAQIGLASGDISEEPNQYSGLLIRLKNKMDPTPVLTVVSEEGQILFKSSQILEQAFLKTLAPRWVEQPTSREITSLIGKKPVSLEGEAMSQGLIRVSEKIWLEAIKESPSLLGNGQVVVALP